MVAQCQGKESYAEYANKDGFPAGRRDRSPGFESQNPHTDTETTNNASKPFSYILENQRPTTKNESWDTSSDKVCALNRIANGWVHNIDDQHRDTQTRQICCGQEYLDPSALDPYQGVDYARYYKNHPCNR